MENHHVAGEWASHETIRICRNCHAMIGAMQREIDPVLREIAAPGLEWVPLAVGWVLVWLQWLRYMVVPAAFNKVAEVAL